MKHLDEFADFLAELIEWEEMPPPINYIKGMPVPTCEALMQGITTHLQIFCLTNMPINQRAVSTVGIESFFSDLTHMEFSGLGCPKAVDIPRLITHVTKLNSIKHDLQHRFSFNTTKCIHMTHCCLPLILTKLGLTCLINKNRGKHQSSWHSLKPLLMANSLFMNSIAKMKAKYIWINEQGFHMHLTHWILFNYKLITEDDIKIQQTELYFKM